MNTINNGGPAFPVVKSWQGGCSGADYSGPSGMSLRDYFAAAALQGLLNGDYVPEEATTLKSWEDLAACAFGLSDAMLAERGKEKCA